VINSTLSGNSANVGGGIFNAGPLTITNSTLSGNSAATDGGGIVNVGSVTVTNSTLSGNSAAKNGGGIVNLRALTMTNSTLSGNSAAKNGGGIDNVGATTVTNSIVANSPAGGDCFDNSEVFTGANIVDTATCGASPAIIRTNPQLGALANNGGPTQTLALQVGSPAIDAAGACGLPTDQRGIARPQGPACDI
jgi:hypothetical protein